MRRAGAADAPALAEFAARLFRATYGPGGDPDAGGGSRAEDVDAYAGAHFNGARQAAELADPGLVTFVAGAPGAAIAGYVQLRLRSPAPRGGGAALPPNVAEVARLYVDGPWRGRGVAGALLDAAADAARAGGAAALWLAVYQRNRRALAYYERRGWRRAGACTFRMGAELQDDWVMVRPLD